MVGIFQIFGINFVFWVLMGILRFIFDTFHAELRTNTSSVFKRFCIALCIGLGITASLLAFFFYEFGDIALTTNTAFAYHVEILSFWIIAFSTGMYFAIRAFYQTLYDRLLMLFIGIGSIACALLFEIFFTSLATQFFIPRGAGPFAVWFVAVFLSGTATLHMAAFMNAREQQKQKEAFKHRPERIKPDDVAIVIAAYNEGLTIGTTIESLLNNTKKEHIYIGSDGSKDNTVPVVRSYGCHIDDIQPNGGKALALEYVLTHNKIFERYKAVFIVDADIKVDPHHFEKSLPQFDDPKVVAVIGRAISLWPKHYIPRWQYFFTAYRIRLWRVLRYCLRYGQTWKYTNMTPIIPGGGSIYRTSALQQMKHAFVPGLIIEDFNLTFNVHHQKLGLISFDPTGPYVMDQEPFSLHDYTNQIWRWYLGFFQTIRYHGVWPSWFFFATAAFTFEMFISAIMFLLVPFAVLSLFFHGEESMVFGKSFWSFEMSLIGIAIGILLIDYLVTVIVAIIERKPLLLVYGIGFLFLRYLEGIVFLYAAVVGLLSKPTTSGRWVSPKRVSYERH